ncbi:glycoside hydrolase [Qipengyuania marisflavi]|uniref:Glycoside hydrolase n=1 Tax=Qipengyuania marisflavi TaxID=2486356 RepID=A0A5S3PAK5_9SPHN|nr:glycoside hydrolase [Qipengyuania marisflavi]
MPAAPPSALGLDPFYRSYLAAEGIPIIASAKVPQEALLAARDMAQGMIAHRPDLARWLAANDYRIALIAEDEALLDLPELRDWKKPARDDVRLTRCELKHYDVRIGALSDRAYWNARARGTGGRHMVGSEEDVLGLPTTRYWGETIFVHEFAHQILDAVRHTDLPLYAEIESAYADAKAAGRFQNEYTMTTADEYWAEGTQFWFNSNRLQVFGGRRILNHTDLAEYDPALYAALGRVYGDNHQLKSDPFYMHSGRVPPGPPPENTAEVC